MRSTDPTIAVEWHLEPRRTVLGKHSRLPLTTKRASKTIPPRLFPALRKTIIGISSEIGICRNLLFQSKSACDRFSAVKHGLKFMPCGLVLVIPRHWLQQRGASLNILSQSPGTHALDSASRLVILMGTATILTLATIQTRITGAATTTAIMAMAITRRADTRDLFTLTTLTAQAAVQA